MKIKVEKSLIDEAIELITSLDESKSPEVDVKKVVWVVQTVHYTLLKMLEPSKDDEVDLHYIVKSLLDILTSPSVVGAKELEVLKLIMAGVKK